MLRRTVTVMVLIVLLSGCAMQDFGDTLKYNLKGEYYLQNKDFARGRQTFAEALQEDPDSAQAHYYYGRFLLAENEAKTALSHLEQAAARKSGDSEYQFWLGLAYGENGLRVKERASYEAALRLDRQNVQALISLGNNLLLAGELEKSLDTYQQALEIWPNHPQALYNRSIILRKMNREPEEKQAWLLYLDSFPAGNFARLATDRLNSLGDSSYRNYQLGARTVTLGAITFQPLSAELTAASRPSLDLVGATVSNMGKGTLNILVYQQNNRELAKKRAIALRTYLEQQFPKLRAEKRIRLSWFAVPEERMVLSRKLTLSESVQFFLTDQGKGKEPATKILRKKTGKK
jgi:tetratricopeptide (TPR) repeat protein